MTKKDQFRAKIRKAVAENDKRWKEATPEERERALNRWVINQYTKIQTGKELV